VTTLTTTLEGFVAAAVAELRWRYCSTCRGCWNIRCSLCRDPAGHAGDRDCALLLIYLPQQTAVIVCAWIVAFFPVLSNTTLGLNSVDRNLAGLFQLYGASRLQTLRYLKLPAALPYISAACGSRAGCR